MATAVMDPFLAHLDALLEKHFPGSEFQRDQAAPAPRIGGFLVWDRFEGTSQRERQRQVWSVLHGNLPVEDQQRVTAILTLTPLEQEAILENE